MPDAKGQALLDALKQYELGVMSSIQQTVQTGKMDQVSAVVASEVSEIVPGGMETVQAANEWLQNFVSSVGGGPYSQVARIGNDIANLDLGKLWKDLGGTRTYGMDSYWGAVYYYRYVQGQSISNQNQISDEMLIPALKWFIDKLGIFISGNEHIVYLNQGVDKYMSLVGVNVYTTTDRTRVQNAYNVLRNYWQYIETDPRANTYPGPPGAWRNTVGVYDNALIGLVTGSAAWQAALNNAKQNYIATDQLPGIASGLGSLVSGDNLLYLIAIVAAVIVILVLITKK